MNQADGTGFQPVEELLEKMNYIKNNPVKTGLAEEAADYKWLYIEGLQYI